MFRTFHSSRKKKNHFYGEEINAGEKSSQGRDEKSMLLKGLSG
jgi:hypothetical protein